MFYLLVKPLIHQTFNIIILACCLLHLSRAHVPFLTKKVNNDEFQMKQLKVVDYHGQIEYSQSFFFRLVPTKSTIAIY